MDATASDCSGHTEESRSVVIGRAQTQQGDTRAKQRARLQINTSTWTDIECGYVQRSMCAGSWSHVISYITPHFLSFGFLSFGCTRMEHRVFTGLWYTLTPCCLNVFDSLSDKPLTYVMKFQETRSKVSEKNHISISWILDPITLFPIYWTVFTVKMATRQLLGDRHLLTPAMP